MLKRFSVFESDKKLDRHEPAVQRLKEDLMYLFKSELEKNIGNLQVQIDKVFDKIQVEFDEGDSPKSYIAYKDGSGLILQNEIGHLDIRGELFCILDAYGITHAGILAAVETEKFEFLVNNSYKTVPITKEQVDKKIESLRRDHAKGTRALALLQHDLSIWENIR